MYKGISLSTWTLFIIVGFVIIILVVLFLISASKNTTISILDMLKTAFGGG